MKRVDLVGQRFGKLLVKSMGVGPNGSTAQCDCDCGNSKTVLAYNLRSGNTKSCGCVRSIAFATQPVLTHEQMRAKIERIRQIGFRNRVHGHTSTPDAVGRRSKTYASWSDAKKRCFSPKNKRFADYGGRGILMCDLWANSFAAFLEDMGERPPGTTLDRINVDEGYEPGNCRWASRFEQAQNTRANVASVESVKAIRRAYEMGATPKQLAKEFGMSASNVGMIAKRHTWKNIE
jgi:hypothetical protein